MAQTLPRNQQFSAAPPLWKLAPTRDQEGVPVADFMLMIPRMSKRGDLFAKQTAEAVHSICENFSQQVIFADLNVRLGVIWISVQAKPGLCAEVAQAIQRQVPEALMVGDQVARAAKGLSVTSRTVRRIRKVLSITHIPRLGVRRP